MDTWATSSLSPQIAAQVGGRPRPVPAARSRWTCDRRRTTSSAPGSSTRCCVPTSSTTRCRGRTRRSAASCSTPTARRCRSPRATSSCRPRCSSGTRPTPCGTGRRAPGSGYDAAIDDQQMKVGRRLAIKLLNASRFALSMEAAARRGHRAARPLDAGHPLGRWSSEATDALDAYEHSKALDVDRAVLLGVHRRLPRAREAARLRRRTAPRAQRRRIGALRTALDVLLRLFAPFLPYVTEEVWSWWREGSVHRDVVAGRRRGGGAGRADCDPAIYEVAAAVLSAVRKEKALAKVSLQDAGRARSPCTTRRTGCAC